jgi:hypothetical protein
MGTRKRGRPPLNLSAEEREERILKLRKASDKRLDTKNMTVNGTLLTSFTKAKKNYGEKLGFEVTTKQFFTHLMNEYEKNNATK